MVLFDLVPGNNWVISPQNAITQVMNTEFKLILTTLNYWFYEELKEGRSNTFPFREGIFLSQAGDNTSGKDTKYNFLRF